MTITEIKKELYKQKPMAILTCASKSGLLYKALVNVTDTNKKIFWLFSFIVPLSDIGDATFECEMPAQLLIRYIVTPETTI